jgi:3-oxoacyl-[acyl-carrier protein] reductase
MDYAVEGRVALVTGASQGIGAAAAHALSREGVHVMLCARNRERLLDATRAVRAHGRAECECADLSLPGEGARVVQETVRHFGRIDILVNNAGGTDALGGYDDLKEEDWLDALRLNLLGPVEAAMAAIPRMRVDGWGRIINVASESASQPDAFFPHYAAAKAALVNATKSMSKWTAGTGILVNAVSPAFVKTPLLEQMLKDVALQRGVSFDEAETAFLAEERPNITLGRAGRPEEVAAVIAFLASESASFVTGTNVRVDAGSVASIA